MNQIFKRNKLTVVYSLLIASIVIYACSKEIRTDKLTSASATLAATNATGTTPIFKLNSFDCIDPTSTEYLFAAPYPCPKTALQRYTDSLFITWEKRFDSSTALKQPRVQVASITYPPSGPYYIPMEVFGPAISSISDEIGNFTSNPIGMELTVYVYQNGTSFEGASFIGLSKPGVATRVIGLYPYTTPVISSPDQRGVYHNNAGYRYSVSITVKNIPAAKMNSIINYITNGLPSAGVYYYNSWTFNGTSLAVRVLNLAGLSISLNATMTTPYELGTYLKVMTAPANATINLQPGWAPLRTGELGGEVD